MLEGRELVDQEAALRHNSNYVQAQRLIVTAVIQQIFSRQADAKGLDQASISDAEIDEVLLHLMNHADTKEFSEAQMLLLQAIERHSNFTTNLLKQQTFPALAPLSSAAMRYTRDYGINDVPALKAHIEEIVPTMQKPIISVLELRQKLLDAGEPVVAAAPSFSREILLTLTLDELLLSTRVRKAMTRLGIYTMEDLLAHSYADFDTVQNFGKTSEEELRLQLSYVGLDLEQGQRVVPQKAVQAKAPVTSRSIEEKKQIIQDWHAALIDLLTKNNTCRQDEEENADHMREAQEAGAKYTELCASLIECVRPKSGSVLSHEDVVAIRRQVDLAEFLYLVSERASLRGSHISLFGADLKPVQRFIAKGMDHSISPVTVAGDSASAGRDEEQQVVSELPPESPDDPFESIERQVRSQIGDVLATLSYREREIMKLRYGIADGWTYSPAEVGRIFHITSNRSNTIEGKAISKLAHSTRVKDLPLL